MVWEALVSSIPREKLLPEIARELEKNSSLKDCDVQWAHDKLFPDKIYDCSACYFSWWRHGTLLRGLKIIYSEGNLGISYGPGFLTSATPHQMIEMVADALAGGSTYLENLTLAIETEYIPSGENLRREDLLAQ